MLTYDQAIELLTGFNIKPPDDWDRHCIRVADIAYKLALEVAKYRDIDPGKVRVMGLVHDFGRHITQDPYRHAYEGYKMMKELGHDDLARICVCHSNGTHKIEDLEEYGLQPSDFYVETLEEMLVFIGDSLECRGEMRRHDERIAETIERYSVRNPEFVPVLQSKIEEFKAFDKVIQSIIGISVYEYFGI
jgi:putative nucleotidyltransferase with HDIG domain